MSEQTAKTGGCLWGAAAYRVTGGLKQVIGCHCSMCRRQTGHDLAVSAAWRDRFELTGDRGLKWFRSSPESRRGFCHECGSVMFFATDGNDKISITAGSRGGATGLAIAAHIFVADKGDDHALDDGTEPFARGGGKVPMPPRLGPPNGRNTWPGRPESC